MECLGNPETSNRIMERIFFGVTSVFQRSGVNLI